MNFPSYFIRAPCRQVFRSKKATSSMNPAQLGCRILGIPWRRRIDRRCPNKMRNRWLKSGENNRYRINRPPFNNNSPWPRRIWQGKLKSSTLKGESFEKYYGRLGTRSEDPTRMADERTSGICSTGANGFVVMEYLPAPGADLLRKFSSKFWHT